MSKAAADRLNQSRTALWARLRLVGGALLALMGIGCLIPAVVNWLGAGALDNLGYVVVGVSLSLIISGLVTAVSELRRRDPDTAALPEPVRAAITCNILFLAFCALEASDGLLRQGGRIMYWTTALFIPALVLLYGQVMARRWAWWVARSVAAVAAAWFFGFTALIPFANLQARGQPAPWYGRVYMMLVSLVFAGIAAYAFRSLGRTNARSYFGLAHDAERIARAGNNPSAVTRSISLPD